MLWADACLPGQIEHMSAPTDRLKGVTKKNPTGSDNTVTCP